MFEQQYDYNKPFYEFFKLLHLEGLNSKETIELLKVIGNKAQSKKITEIIKTNPARIETLRTITGGVPRTIVMLFDIFIQNNGNAYNDLMQVLDDVTPLYQSRMKLSDVHQDIVHTIAMNWDAMLTKDIAKKTRLASKVVSAQLKLLEKNQIIQAESLGKNKIYIIKERFFNIWYLMRHGRKKDRQRVEWLVKFLMSWYNRKELGDKAKELISTLTISEPNNDYIYHLGKALSYAGLDTQIEHQLKQSMKQFFHDNKSSYANQVTPSDAEILQQAFKLQDNNNSAEAIELLIKSKKESATILFIIGYLYYEQKQYDKAESYYLKAIESGNINATNSLAWMYFNQATEATQALKLIKSSYKQQNNYHNTHTLSVIELWAEEFSNSYSHFEKWLAHKEAIENEEDVTLYLNLLMAKGQYYQAKEFFEMPNYQLKERYKPLWYALMTLMQDDFPHEIKKMGSELKQTVKEILEEIDKLKLKYTID